jgi:hypothetical protein
MPSAFQITKHATPLLRPLAEPRPRACLARRRVSVLLAPVRARGVRGRALHDGELGHQTRWRAHQQTWAGRDGGRVLQRCHVPGVAGREIRCRVSFSAVSSERARGKQARR